MKSRVTLWVCVLAMGLVPSASAVTVELSSPQAGETLEPGDTLEITLTVTNDTDEPDQVVSVLDSQVTVKNPGDGIPDPGPGNIRDISHKPIRIKLGPGESVTRHIRLVLPDYSQLPAGEYAATVSVESDGQYSRTTAGDSFSFTLKK